jgi:chemotaxis protein methyltransferase CheR
LNREITAAVSGHYRADIMDLSHIYFAGRERPATAVGLYGSPSQRIGALHARIPAKLVPPARSAFREDATTGLDPFLSWLLRSVDLKPEVYRNNALQRRLPACLRALRVPSTDRARSLLQTRPELIATALDSLLIGVSEFFRDPAVFDRLHAEVLPSLLGRKPGLRVLAVGVSQGQELYSVAMLLAELGAIDSCELVGIDCRPDAISRAEFGAYSDAELQGMKPFWRDKYFRQVGPHWLLIDPLRRAARWRLTDLRHCQGEVWDVILFRNVAIYLAEDAARSAWEQFTTQLSPGGVLITGKSERPFRELPLQRLAPCVYHRRS